MLKKTKIAFHIVKLWAAAGACVTLFWIALNHFFDSYLMQNAFWLWSKLQMLELLSCPFLSLPWGDLSGTSHISIFATVLVSNSLLYSALGGLYWALFKRKKVIKYPFLTRIYILGCSIPVAFCSTVLILLLVRAFLSNFPTLLFPLTWLASIVVIDRVLLRAFGKTLSSWPKRVALFLILVFSTTIAAIIASAPN